VGLNGRWKKDLITKIMKSGKKMDDKLDGIIMRRFSKNKKLKYVKI
jgi:hypothetical protein